MKHLLQLPMQFFAEGGGSDPGTSGGSTPGNTSDTPKGDNPSGPGTNQNNSDPAVYTKKQVDALLEQARTTMEQEYKNQQSQAERLASMGSEERFKLELQQAKEAAEAAVAQLNAYKLKDEAVKLAGEEGLPLCFLQHFDFGSMSAEQVNTAVKAMAAEYKREISKQLSEKLKQYSPQGGSPNGGMSEAAAFMKEYSARATQ